jgi:hypothetical protein
VPFCDGGWWGYLACLGDDSSTFVATILLRLLRRYSSCGVVRTFMNLGYLGPMILTSWIKILLHFCTSMKQIVVR